MAERSRTIAGENTSIPKNNHPVRIGIDQQGGNKIAGEFGRVSVIGRALTADQVAALARQAHDKSLADRPVWAFWPVLQSEYHLRLKPGGRHGTMRSDRVRFRGGKSPTGNYQGLNWIGSMAPDIR